MIPVYFGNMPYSALKPGLQIRDDADDVDYKVQAWKEKEGPDTSQGHIGPKVLFKLEMEVEPITPMHFQELAEKQVDGSWVLKNYCQAVDESKIPADISRIQPGNLLVNEQGQMITVIETDVPLKKPLWLGKILEAFTRLPDPPDKKFYAFKGIIRNELGDFYRGPVTLETPVFKDEDGEPTIANFSIVA